MLVLHHATICQVRLSVRPGRYYPSRGCYADCCSLVRHISRHAAVAQAGALVVRVPTCVRTPPHHGRQVCSCTCVVQTPRLCMFGLPLGDSFCGVVQGVQLMAHGFHEGRPVFSTGTIPPAQSEADLCEVVPLGRSCNLLLPPSSRPRRQVAVFLGRPVTEPPLLPCPITMLADERLHGSVLHHRILLNLGADGIHYSSISLQSPLPGLPAEQLLFLPPDLGWNDVLLPIDLRPLGGCICLVRDQGSATCGQLL